VNNRRIIISNMHKSIRILFAILAYFCWVCNVNAADCSAYFTDTIQGHSASSKIKFKDTGKVISDSDTVLNFPTLDDQSDSGNNTCNTTDCSVTGAQTSALTLPSFNTTSASNDIDVSSGTSTIGSGGTYSVTEIKDLTVSSSANVTFLASATKYKISKGKFSNSAVVTFNSGQYWFNELEITNSTQIIINGPVTIFVNTHFDIENSAFINVSGAAKDLVIVGYEQIHLKDDVQVHAVLYGAGQDVKLENDAKLTGVISANGTVEIKNTASVTYESASGTEVADLCSGSSITIDHYEIIHDGSGSTCQSESVTIKACTDAACSTTLSSSVSLSFQGDGSTISSPTFTGSTTFTYDHTTAETLTLSVASPSVTATGALVCSGGSGSSCDIAFSSSGCTTSCATYFPDTAQGNTASSFIRFRNTARVVSDPDNTVSFPSISDWTAFHNTCDTVDCSTTSSAVPAFTVPSFEMTSTNTDVSTSSGTSTIGSGGTYSVNEIDDLTISGSSNVTFLASATKYVVDTAYFSGTSVITLNAGEYWFDFLEIKGSVQIIVNGAVTIFVNQHFDIENTVQVNVSGDAKDLSLVGYDKIHLKNSVEFHGAIYGSGGQEVKLQNTAKVFGAVSASGKLELKHSSYITYEDVSGLEVAGLCGSPTAPTISTLTASCSALNQLTLAFSEDVSSSTAQNTSNYSLANAASGSVTINSAVRSPDNTVTLTTATTLNDFTEYTLTVNNVEDLEGNAMTSNSTATVTLACSQNCITDSFVGPGSLNSTWSVGNNSGAFGDPTIVSNGRLRLTDASGNVATVATLLKKFPGAENRIEIEFDYYGYDGSGADGVAVIFSDATVSAVTGAYGGSLGYAQRTGVDGFAGGWLGVGLDEYGNFSAANEGKSGGTGFLADSVALRGSGSGSSGYPFLANSGVLSPGVDQSGSTPNPGDRYKIIIDHTMGGGVANVSVERDTGSGYSVIVTEFDIFTVNASQASVPADWQISFTGSTGGATNIHEIGDLKICAAQPITDTSSVDHYAISHSSIGVTCEASQITATAHDASHNVVSVSSDTDLTITTTPTVSGIVSTPATISNGSSSTTFYINQTSALSGIDIDVTDGTNTDPDDAGSEDATFSFLDTAFRFYADSSNTDTTPIVTQTASESSTTTGQSLELRAIRTNTDTGACEAALQGTSAVNIAYECKSPTACSAGNLVSFTGGGTKSVASNDNGSSLSYTSVNMVFDANGAAPFSFKYSDAGQITLHAQKIVAASSPDPAFTLTGSSNAFWVKPKELVITAKSSGTALDNTSASDPTPVHKAGVGFDLVVTAVNADGGTTPNYVLGQSQLSLARTGPTTVAGLEGDLKYSAAGTITSALSSTFQNATLTSFTAGVSSYSAANYSEVGLINLDIKDIDYGGLGVTIDADAINIGRFIPNQFLVTVSDGSFLGTCGSFTYTGQPFTYDSAPAFTITAQNAAGNTTGNYTDPDYLKLLHSNINSNRTFPTTDGTTTGASSALMALTPSSGDGTLVETSQNSGIMTYSFNASDTFTYIQETNAITGPFNPDLTITTTQFSDSDSVQSLTVPDVTPTATATPIRYGRWRMENIYGPETSSLSMVSVTEYLDGSGNWLTNTLDSCTDLSARVSINQQTVGTNYTSIAVGGGTTDFTLTSPVALGIASYSFTPPNAGNTGEVDVGVDLALHPWLRHDWDDDGDFEDHTEVTATFGVYRGHDRVIYWREIP